MRKIVLPFLLVAAAVIGCSDKISDSHSDDNLTEYKPERKGFFVLSKGAGSWGASASLARYDKPTNKMMPNYYKSINKEDLGRDATDILTYGSKFYVISSATNKMVVSDIHTGKKITEIDFGQTPDETNVISPRRMVSDGGYIYILVVLKLLTPFYMELRQ